MPYLAEEITHNIEKDLANIEVVTVEDDGDEKGPEVQTPAKEDKKAPEAPTETKATEVEHVPETSIGEEMGKIADETIADMAKSLTDDEEDEGGDATVYRLPAPKVKEVRAIWKKYSEHCGWNFEDSERKRKATIKKYYNVETINEMSEDDAEDFIAKITKALEKPAPKQ